MSKFFNLTKKIAAVLGSAMAALTGAEANDNMSTSTPVQNDKVIEMQHTSKLKPMPVMKLKSVTNMELNQFVASHGSHRSHSSHSSHSSHYSHRSGGM